MRTFRAPMGPKELALYVSRSSNGVWFPTLVSGGDISLTGTCAGNLQRPVLDFPHASLTISTPGAPDASKAATTRFESILYKKTYVKPGTMLDTCDHVFKGDLHTPAHRNALELATPSTRVGCQHTQCVILTPTDSGANTRPLSCCCSA